MPDSILQFYARNHASFLHGHGVSATRKMLAQLQLSGGERLLEIGCGTGASLILLKSAYPNLDISGGDISKLMYRKAQKRISFSGLDGKLNLLLLEKGKKLPFPGESMDIIWIESVLAILKTPILEQMLTEIHRVLQPNGTLIFNESLWLPNIRQEVIDNINEQCLKHFGIIQANGDYPTSKHWQALLEKHGFKVLLSAEFRELNRSNDIPQKLSYRRSQLFNLIGKFWAFTSLQQRAYQKKLRQLELQIMGEDAQKVKAYLFKAQKS